MLLTLHLRKKINKMKSDNHQWVERKNARGEEEWCATGGWIPVVRQRGGQGRGMTEGSIRYFTIFVDNIPNSVNLKGLHKLFTKFGVVKDVFISQKRRKITNTRFGFVRFDYSVAATVAVQKTDGLWVDDKAIQVKHADYGKEKAGSKGLIGPMSLQAPRQFGYQREGRSGVEGFKDQRSYAETVIGKTSDGKGSNTIKAEEIGNGWLYESVVVRLKGNYAKVNLKKELEAIRIEDVLVRESGGRDVVLTFKSNEEMILQLQPIKELIMD
ncbi:hypothetical protein ACSBR2_023502 [Camellia fascicularis]